MKRAGSRGFTIVELLIVVVVIAILAAITVVAYNGVTQRATVAFREATLSQWRTQAATYRVKNSLNECPDNYVFVYGNSTLGTGDFCVMKYEAKIQGNDVGSTAYASAMVAESRASGTPWTNINQTQAIAESAGAGGHLITEAEWMTIAADVLSVDFNWSGNKVGSGIVHQGHIANAPASAIAASSDDSDVTYGMTATGSTIESNSSRVLYLKSGEAIWDISGNVWEWTSGTISGVGSQPSPTGWKDYSSVTNWGSVPATSRPSTLATIPGLGGITGWGSVQGMGTIYSNPSLTTVYTYSRGGPWYSGGNGGVLLLSLNLVPTASVNDQGFRVTTSL